METSSPRAKQRCCRCRERIERNVTGRRRRYCSAACRQAAYRKRLKRPILLRSGGGMACCEWPTDPQLFSRLNAEFGFSLDVCATPQNAKCPRYFTREQDGLRQRWEGRVWCNPPYGRAIGQWVKKAWESVQEGTAELVACLLPARVDTAWWHAYCVMGEIRFFRGRLRFGDLKYPAPFPSALVLFCNREVVTKRATA